MWHPLVNPLKVGDRCDLAFKPDHPGINEYLGELYIQTNRIDLAKERLEVLKNCKCEEYDELKELIENN